MVGTIHEYRISKTSQPYLDGIAWYNALYSQGIHTVQYCPYTVCTGTYCRDILL